MRGQTKIRFLSRRLKELTERSKAIDQIFKANALNLDRQIKHTVKANQHLRQDIFELRKNVKDMNRDIEYVHEFVQKNILNPRKERHSVKPPDRPISKLRAKTKYGGVNKFQ